jgi:hypothetical protein
VGSRAAPRLEAAELAASRKERLTSQDHLTCSIEIISTKSCAWQ